MNSGLMKSLIDNTRKAGQRMDLSLNSLPASSTSPGSRHTGTTMGNAGETGPQQMEQKPLKLVVNNPAPVAAPKPTLAPALAPVRQQASQEQKRPSFSAFESGKMESPARGKPVLSVVQGGLTQAPQPARAPALAPVQQQAPQEQEGPAFSAGIQGGLTQAPQRPRKPQEELGNSFHYAPEGMGFPSPNAYDEIVEAANIRELQQAQQAQVGVPSVAMAA